MTALNPSDDTAAAADTAADGAHGLFAGACNAKMKMLVLVLGSGVAATTTTTGDDRRLSPQALFGVFGIALQVCVSLVTTCPPLPFPSMLNDVCPSTPNSQLVPCLLRVHFTPST